jgi:hypothetical protein
VIHFRSLQYNRIMRDLDRQKLWHLLRQSTGAPKGTDFPAVDQRLRQSALLAGGKDMSHSIALFFYASPGAEWQAKHIWRGRWQYDIFTLSRQCQELPMAAVEKKRTFSLPAEHTAFIDTQVASRAFASGSEGGAGRPAGFAGT